MLFVKRLFTKKRIVVLIIVLGVLYALYSRFGKKDTTFETATIEQGDVREELILSGEVKATEDANLQFNSYGTISWIGVKEGDVVKKGQVLAKLDTTELNSSFQRAQADLRSAEATVARVHDDLKDKGNSETYEEKETRTIAEVAKDKAYENYISSQKALANATLTSPFSGIVTYVANQAAGVNVTIGSTQLRIVNPNTIYLSVNADQTEVSRFSVGDAATMVFDAFEDETVSGTISSISLSPDPTESGTVYPIRISLSADTSLYKYRIGMTGDATFLLQEKKNTLFAPSRFIKTDRKGKYVLVNDGKERHYVELGIEGSDRIELKTDLPVGTRIYN